MPVDRAHPPWPVVCRDVMIMHIVLALLLGSLLACQSSKPRADSVAARADTVDPHASARTRMVREQLAARGIRDTTVLAAMTRVPRHRFVPPAEQRFAYADHPLPIGFDQTISQPYIVAYMAEAAQIAPHEKVLEIGTGSGYGAAILGQLAREVYTIELIPELAERARTVLNELGYANVTVRAGDGYAGWREHAPFDAIVVTAAPDHVPPALVEQLAMNGRMIIPVGKGDQEMRVITRTSAGITEESTMLVRFVPLVRPPTGSSPPPRP
jgi:protein-L-isoaspartate(D-aspartate) O-methyltransferase